MEIPPGCLGLDFESCCNDVEQIPACDVEIDSEIETIEDQHFSTGRKEDLFDFIETPSYIQYCYHVL